MYVLTVTSQSNLSELAHSLAQFLQNDAAVAIEAEGHDAVGQLAQILTLLRRQWEAETSDLLFITEVDVDRESDADQPYLQVKLATSRIRGGEFSAGAQTIDEEIEDEFEEWEVMPDENNALLEKIRLHHSESPILSGGDVDAAWDQANDGGEETVGGSTPTPDQDVVDDLGEAAGLIYQDEEPLHTADKLERRDKHRWELNPASQDDEES